MHHAYVKVLGTGEDMDFKKCIYMVELCTNLTAYMFLLAVVSNGAVSLLESQMHSLLVIYDCRALR